MRETQQRLLHILARPEALRLEHMPDAPVEALHHPVGRRRTGSNQPMLDAQLSALLVELLITRGLALPAGKETIGELLAVIDQQRDNLEGAALV